MYLTRSGLSKPGVFLLMSNLLVTVLKVRPHGSFSTSPIKSFQYWRRLFFMPRLKAGFTTFHASCRLHPPLSGWISAALRGIHDVAQLTGCSTNTSKHWLSGACEEASSSRKLRLPSASRSAQLLLRSQHGKLNQARQWAWFIRGLLEDFLCYVVLFSRRGSFFCRPYPYPLLGTVVLGWNRWTSGHSRLPLENRPVTYSWGEARRGNREFNYWPPRSSTERKRKHPNEHRVGLKENRRRSNQGYKEGCRPSLMRPYTRQSFVAERDSSLFWISITLLKRHLWVLSIPLNTSLASFTLSVAWRGLFPSIPCCMMLWALAKLFIFSFYSFRSWRTPFHPSAPEEAVKSTFSTVFVFTSIHFFTSASCVDERVGIVWNGCTLGPKSCPSSLRPDLRLAGPGIHGHTGLTRSNTGSDTCVQYALPDQGLEGASSWSRMAHHLGRSRLTSALPPGGPGKKPLRDEEPSVGYHSGMVTDCGGFAVSPRRFHSPIRSLPHSRESPSKDSSFRFEGNISQSCGVDIHSVHSFLLGIHPSSYIGIDASIAFPAFKLG